MRNVRVLARLQDARNAGVCAYARVRQLRQSLRVRVPHPARFSCRRFAGERTHCSHPRDYPSAAASAGRWCRRRPLTPSRTREPLAEPCVLGLARRACPCRCSRGTCRTHEEAAATASCRRTVLGERRRADELVHAEPQLAATANAAAEAAKQPPPAAGRPHAAGMANLKGRTPTGYPRQAAFSRTPGGRM